MQLELVAHGVSVTPSLQETVTRYVTNALERFSDHVSRVLVTLKDLNGPRGGGGDKRCLIEVKLAHTGSLVARADAPLFEPAVHRAAARIRRRLLSTKKR